MQYISFYYMVIDRLSIVKTVFSTITTASALMSQKWM